MSRYVSMPAYPDRMPVDISFVFEKEKPAGRHGFLYADGDELRFEDGTLGRFWGVNLNGGACFPDRDYAEKLVRRLAAVGCNVVRFHQLDAEWDTPNLFSFAKGCRIRSTRQFDPRCLDRLDYLISLLKEAGIYCYLDMITYRKFKEDDGVPFHEDLLDAGKPWSLLDPDMIRLQKEYCTALWTHVNPYTGLAYKDDPVFILTEIINENDLFQPSPQTRSAYVEIPYYVDQFREAFRLWLEKKGLSFDWQGCDLYDTSEEMIRFKMELTEDYYDRMYRHLRSIGVRIPIAGTNWTRCDGFIKTHEKMDFTDSHHYFYEWRWADNERFCSNRSLTSVPAVFPALARMKIANKPFFVSEWDVPWPNSYRAEGSIYYAAVGALQNWSGFTIHTYSYSASLQEGSILGRELSTPVAGVPYREGIFSVWNDPAKYGLFYHAALILRRGDVAPAKKKVALRATDLANSPKEALSDLLEQHRTATVFDEKVPEGYHENVPADQHYPQLEKKRIVSDHGLMWRDLSRRIGVIDTPRTKVLYGFLGLGGNTPSSLVRRDQLISLHSLEVECYTDFAVIALSSLNDEGLAESDNILLSAIGRARNTDASFDGEKMLSPGRPPIQAEVIRADVRLHTVHGQKMKVWGVNAEGFYCAKLPTKYEDGVLSFTIGTETCNACYYLIVKE